MNLLKSVLHNIGVLVVGIVFGLIGVTLDLLCGAPEFQSPLTLGLGLLFLIIGFLIRVWATFDFYKEYMRVIVLTPQRKLITTGAFRFSRNPLYLGGNVFIFLGAVLCFGSPSGIVLTAIAIFFTDRMIRREEKQLARQFGDEWTRYKAKVPRWI